MITYNKYRKMGSIHWKWYMGKNIGYKVLVNESIKYFPDKGTIIDIGCGDGLPSCLLAEKGLEVTGIEPEMIGLTIAKDRLSGLNFAGYETTIEDFVKENDQKFDYLYSLNTIEHVDDENAFVEMMKRTKNFGIIITDNKDSKKRKHPYHTKEYNRESLKELFKDFKTEDINFSDEWVNNHFIGLKIYA